MEACNLNSQIDNYHTKNASTICLSLSNLYWYFPVWEIADDKRKLANDLNFISAKVCFALCQDKLLFSYL